MNHHLHSRSDRGHRQPPPPKLRPIIVLRALCDRNGDIEEHELDGHYQDAPRNSNQYVACGRKDALLAAKIIAEELRLRDHIPGLSEAAMDVPDGARAIGIFEESASPKAVHGWLLVGTVDLYPRPAMAGALAAA